MRWSVFPAGSAHWTKPGSADAAADGQAGHGAGRADRRSGRNVLEGVRPFVRHQLLDEAMISERRSAPVQGDRPCGGRGGGNPAVSIACITACVTSGTSWCCGSSGQAVRGATLAALHEQFGDLLVAGTFTVEQALPEERDEPELKHLARLVFPFNRRNLGRLRALIDYLQSTVRYR